MFFSIEDDFEEFLNLGSSKQGSSLPANHGISSETLQTVIRPSTTEKPAVPLKPAVARKPATLQKPAVPQKPTVQAKPQIAKRPVAPPKPVPRASVRSTTRTGV